ncbi:hypothetical protein RFI_14629, partial [Reticulomyxa filosa]
TSSLLHDEYVKLYLIEIQQAMQLEETSTAECRAKYGYAKNDFVELTGDFAFNTQLIATKGTLGVVREVKDHYGNPIVDVAFPELGRSCDVQKRMVVRSEVKRQLPPELQGGHVGVLRTKLIQFLKTSKHYNPKTTLDLFKDCRDTLLEEQVWIRARIPQHDRALEIILFRLEDPAMADMYCDLVWTRLESKIVEEAKVIARDLMMLSNVSSTNPTGATAGSSSVFEAKQNSYFGVGSLRKDSEVSLSTGMRSTIPVSDNKDDYNFDADSAYYGSHMAAFGGLLDEDKLKRDGALDSASSKALLAEIMQTMSPELRQKALSHLLVENENAAAYRIYETLFDVYLNAKPLNMCRLTNEALQLLTKYHTRVNTEAIIGKLPASLPVKFCKPYLKVILKTLSEKKRDYQIVNNLLKHTQLRLQLKKIKIESDFQWVTENTVCKKCEKWIGQAAFLRFPNGNN